MASFGHKPTNPNPIPRTGKPNKVRGIWPKHPPHVKMLFERQTELGWTDKELSYRSGYAASYLSILRHGHNRSIPLHTYFNLAEALGIKIHFTFEEPKNYGQK